MERKSVTRLEFSQKRMQKESESPGQTVETANKTKTIRNPKQGKPSQTPSVAVNAQHGRALQRPGLLSWL